jgi:hypothetical protein
MGPLIGKPGKPVFSLSFQCSSTVRSRIKSHAVPVTTTKSSSRTLYWTTRTFIFAKQREYENGPPALEPSGETIVRGRDRGKRKEAELMPRTQVTGKADLAAYRLGRSLQKPSSTKIDNRTKNAPRKRKRHVIIFVFSQIPKVRILE